MQVESDPRHVDFSPTGHAAPVMRVVVPAFKANRTIRDVVAAILKSNFDMPFEIVVADDGENGDLALTLKGLPVALVATGGTRSAAAARNRGAKGFAGRFLLFIDADVIVEPQCIQKLIEPLRNRQAEATVGNYSRNVEGLTYSARYKQLYISRIYERRAGYLRNEFWTGVGAINADTFRALNGFDPKLAGAGGEDTELGIRMTRRGLRILAVPDAIGHHRRSLSLGQLFRNDWRKGLAVARSHFRHDTVHLDNRHATSRDILAVVAAVLMLGTPLLVLGPPFVVVAIAAPLLAVYLGLRADILKSFALEGAWFLSRALGIMYLLDLTRAACMVAGFGGHLAEPISGAPLTFWCKITWSGSYTKRRRQ
jgi:GT2 family glycosyltransferase